MLEGMGTRALAQKPGSPGRSALWREGEKKQWLALALLLAGVWQQRGGAVPASGHPLLLPSQLLLQVPAWRLASRAADRKQEVRTGAHSTDIVMHASAKPLSHFKSDSQQKRPQRVQQDGGAIGSCEGLQHCAMSRLCSKKVTVK